MLPFDKRGVCEAPATHARLLEDVAAGRYTDIFVFSHGWNNDWPGAVRAYRHFINGFMPVSYTHLDVYKRQGVASTAGSQKPTKTKAM